MSKAYLGDTFSIAAKKRKKDEFQVFSQSQHCNGGGGSNGGGWGNWCATFLFF